MAEEEKAIEAVEDQDNVAALKETAKAKLLNGANSDSMSNGHDDPNGNGKSSEEVEEDDEVETIEGDDDEPMEADDDDSDDIIEEGRSPNGEAEEVETAEDEEEEEESEDDEIQEVKDDSSDSDVMEVEAEDPLKEVKVSSSVTSTEVKKPQVVTIDDPKQLQALASSAAKSKAERDKVTVIDTSAILAGRSTSGVTITPASSSSFKASSSSASVSKDSSALPPSLASSLAASGVTISSKSTPPSSSRASPAPSAPAAPASAFTYDSKGQLKDPNLTDDTIVIEAPSFIVPYVYEKPPKETFEAFKAEIKKLMDELKKEAAKQESEVPAKKEKKKKKKRKRKKSGSGEEDNGEREDDDDYDAEMEDDETDSDDSEIVEVGKRAASPELPEVKKPHENYFESTLGKFVSNLGMTLVQETVQVDLLRQQQKKAKKDKSAAVMHAIMSLKQNIEQSKENNEAFHFKEVKCRFCSFRTESQLVLEHHLETPHMKNGLYRCNYCPYEVKSAAEIQTHTAGCEKCGYVKARLERAPLLHQCPQCPFEDMMKGKLTRHKVGCDKRFRPEQNQAKPLDWEPPAKIPKPPQPPGRPAASLLNAQGQYGRNLNQNFAGVRGAFQQLNQRNIRPAMYSGMPALQFGPRGAGRPPLARPFIPNRQMQAAGIRNNAARLAGNPSVTIQSISKTGGFKSNNPSISITPVSGGAGRGAGAGMKPGGLKPGAPKTGKDSVQICEICDGYIRDLEQLRNHMQFIHKVKIHPKMIHNRPPLNCQKCQYRFFTDQGLERHLLGSHGLVTASMQDLANKGQDSGRCPVCGKMFHWKLLNHVAKDHSKTLKPAHLSYKCTVCTATFGQYKLFENHVYSAHSGGRKVPQNKPMGAAANRQPQKAIPGRPFKVSDEITIIPQGKNTQANKPKPVVPVPVPKKKPPTEDADIIELDDEEEEIDDVEEDGGEKKRNGNNQSPRKKNDESAKTSSANSAAEESGEEGVEEIRDDDEAEEEDDD